MKHLMIIIFALIPFYVISQSQTRLDSVNYYKLVEGSKNSEKYRLEMYSDVDSTWNKWSLRGYNFGFNKHLTPMYSTINGIISTPYMIQVRGNENERNMKRWGFHVFEGYARDDKSRITLLVNKHIEVGKPVAEMYYYGTKYNHTDSAYNWFRIGSDVRQHSFLFSRDQAIFYGSLKLTNTITLGKIGADNIKKEALTKDADENFEESAKLVNYKSLKNAENGTIFYDKDNNIVVIKINGEWRKVMTEPLPKGVNYDF